MKAERLRVDVVVHNGNVAHKSTVWVKPDILSTPASLHNDKRQDSELLLVADAFLEAYRKAVGK